MKIYTKTGDSGETGLRGGRRVKKNDLRVQAYGEVDELNSFIGLALSCSTEEMRAPLGLIQNELFVVGAILSAEKDDTKAGSLPEEAVSRLESEIDRLELDLPPLKQFILPGGAPAGAALHLARTVCRRAERALCTLSSDEYPPIIERYINRLSDYLFTAARWTNHHLKQIETPWKGLS